MKEWRVVWLQQPYAYNPPRVLFVEAETKENAKTIARDHIERTLGITGIGFDTCTEVIPMPSGKVKGS